MVLVYHAYYWGTNLSIFPPAQRVLLNLTWAGRFGVNLFFVLSGFLITGLLIDSRSCSTYYKRFYVRRVLRIVPAYLLTLGILFAARIATPKFLGLSVLYLSNLSPLFGVALEYPILWSLAVEEHFYLFWPVVVHKLTNRGILFCSAAIVLGSPFLRLLTYYHELHKGYVSYKVFDYTWNSADGLACGAILALVLREFPPSRKKFAMFLVFLGTLGSTFLLAGFLLGILSRHGAAGAALQVVPWHLTFTALLGAALLLGSGPWRAKARSSILEFFGRISYGLYLYHLLFFWLFEWLVKQNIIHKLQIDTFQGLTIRFLVVGATAVIFSYLSRRFFEDPFLRLKDRWTQSSYHPQEWASSGSASAAHSSSSPPSLP
jgi:peptidoglycan/LPS O-acetylase OafA/YrhL